jgi:hypothetical protein
VGKQSIACYSMYGVVRVWERTAWCSKSVAVGMELRIVFS